MTTWKKGRQIVATRLQVGSLPIELLVADIRESQPTRVPGTAVFMHKDPDGTPPALLHNVKHNRVLHQRVVLMSIETFYERECQERAPPRLDAKPCWAWHSATPWLE